MKNLRPQSFLRNGSAGYRALLAAEVRVLDAAGGLVEYVASDESIDSYKEIVRVDGWHFDLMDKNSPFVDTHDYSTIGKQLGDVVDWKIDKRNRRLVETVRWAKDVKENQLAQLGWAMLSAGFGPRAVSVGFMPDSWVSKWDNDRKPWLEQLQDLGLHEESGVRAIYISQQQIELSACIIGANSNALQLAGKAYKAGALTDDQWAAYGTLSLEQISREPAAAANAPGDAAAARHQARENFLRKFEQLTK